jgi:hypothetical protein
MALTDTSIKRLKPKARSYLVSDSQGLGLEILPSGSRSWRYRYRLNGKLEKVSLGHYPAFNLQAARKKRDEYAEMLAHGSIRDLGRIVESDSACRRVRVATGDVENA